MIYSGLRYRGVVYVCIVLFIRPSRACKMRNYSFVRCCKPVTILKGSFFVGLQHFERQQVKGWHDFCSC